MTAQMDQFTGSGRALFPRRYASDIEEIVLALTPVCVAGIEVQRHLEAQCGHQVRHYHPGWRVPAGGSVSRLYRGFLPLAPPLIPAQSQHTTVPLVSVKNIGSKTLNTRGNVPIWIEEEDRWAGKVKLPRHDFYSSYSDFYTGKDIKEFVHFRICFPGLSMTPTSGTGGFTPPETARCISHERWGRDLTTGVQSSLYRSHNTSDQ